MKNLFTIIIFTFGISACIIFSVVFANEHQAKRYKLCFGTIRKEFATVGRDETEKPYRDLKLEYEIVPICIKIDTVTGKTWVYKNDIVHDKDEDGISNVYQRTKFTELPFMEKHNWVPLKK